MTQSQKVKLCTILHLLWASDNIMTFNIPAPLVECTREQQHSVIWFFCSEHLETLAVYRRWQFRMVITVSQRKVYEWVERHRAWQRNVVVDIHSGWPLTVTRWGLKSIMINISAWRIRIDKIVSEMSSKSWKEAVQQWLRPSWKHFILIESRNLKTVGPKAGQCVEK
jgi:hypothetical protein